jgi:type VI secretion system secreted protein VgrG
VNAPISPAAADAFRLRLEKLPDVARVGSFAGFERVNGCHRFDVTVTLPPIDPADLDRHVLGRRAALSFLGEGQSARRVAGVISRATWLAVLARGELCASLRLVPSLSLLRRTRQSRIFQEQTTREILTAVLEEHHIRHRWELGAEPNPRRYCVQHRERDYDLFTRLLAEEGMFFFFEDAGESGLEETLVIGDDPLAYPMIGGRLPLVAREDQGSGGLRAEEHHVHDLVRTRVERAQAAFVQAYDFSRPRQPHQASAEVAVDTPWHKLSAATRDALARRDQPIGRFYQAIEDATIGGPHAAAGAPWKQGAVLLEQLASARVELSGRTSCRRLRPGARFSLDGHSIAELNGREYVVASLTHRGSARAFAAESQSAAAANGRSDEEAYSATFRCGLATRKLRPRPAKRRTIQVAETATVIGSGAAGEIDTDEHGRIRVRFHWDLARDDAAGSCWIRTAQSWAGNSWGTQFIPRIGMEVIVVFLGGDPDMPVVVGSLPNALTPLPFGLPELAATSGIRTHSIPGGEGYNELRFVDTKSEELVQLRGERNIRVEAQRDLQLQAGRDRKDTTGGDQQIRVQGEQVTSVARDRSARVGRHDRLEVAGTFTAKAEKNLELAAGGLLRLQSEGAVSLSSPASLQCDVGLNASIAVSSPEGTLQLGSSGSVSVVGGRGLFLGANGTITLSVGSTRIEVSAEGVTVSADSIKLDARRELIAKGDGPAIALAKEAEVMTKKLTILSEGAELTLDKDAQLRGSKVAIGSRQKDGRADQQPGEQKTKRFEVKLSNENFEPYGDKHYLLMAEGARLEGTTGVDGEIDVQIPESATTVTLKAWLGEYPTGKTKSWLFQLVTPPPPNTVRGALSRLANLGYFQGKPDDRLDDAGRAALKWFQLDHKLPQTGELDGPTVAKLVAAHGE